MNRAQAAQANCRTSALARGAKAEQLEREIRQSSANDVEKANMLFTLSKLGIFSSDERDFLVRVASPKNTYSDWLKEDIQ